MERVRIFSLKGLSRRQFVLIRDGQREAARVWTLCRDAHLAARTSRQPWPQRDALQKATKGLFALYSQTIQMMAHTFLAAVDSARENRRNGRRVASRGTERRYPYKDKRFFPLMWPAQAMRCEERRILLPMGRGRASLVLPRPPGLLVAGACKIVWNGRHNELPVSTSSPGRDLTR